MTRRIALVPWLVLVWVVLWEGATAANVLSGLLIALALLAAFPPRVRHGSFALRPWAALRFAVYFIGKLIEANAVVAWEVMTPRNRIAEGIVAVPLPPGPTGLVALVANAVSLTPGTLTLEVRSEPTVLFVHVLHLHSATRTRQEIQRLDRLVRAAFAPLPEGAG